MGNHGETPGALHKKSESKPAGFRGNLEEGRSTVRNKTLPPSTTPLCHQQGQRALPRTHCATTDGPGAAGMSPRKCHHQGGAEGCGSPSPAAVSPWQHPKIWSGSVGAPSMLFSQLWDQRDPAPAVLGGREGSRPAQGQQLTPALTAASKTSDQTCWGTQELRKGGSQ